MKSIFQRYIEYMSNQKRLIVQPRMGFSSTVLMRKGLREVSCTSLARIGTITIDSFTRVGDLKQAAKAVEKGLCLNGYPIATYSAKQNSALIRSISSQNFPIQIRHGSAKPITIFKAMADMGLDATEGGPISYCLPYGNCPLKESIRAWKEACQYLAEESYKQQKCFHLESFGGCMLGQMCPPSLLVAITILEGIFFEKYGIQSVSMSFAQGCNIEQDEGALLALKKLAEQYIKTKQKHIVVYTFMGKFPLTKQGAYRLIKDSAYLAKKSNAERLIVKTATESYKIPSIQDNIDALYLAAHAESYSIEVNPKNSKEFAANIYKESQAIIESVLNSAKDIDTALLTSFKNGLLDIPYCLHPDNAKKATSYISPDGTINWLNNGSINIVPSLSTKNHRLLANQFLDMLSFNQIRYDKLASS